MSKLKHLKVLKPPQKAGWGIRGFQRDSRATDERNFKDKRSYVSHDGHDLLYGVDKSERRAEIFDHYGGICGHCGKPVNFNNWHWHHVSNEHNNFRRCDCISGASVRHPVECHLALEHVQTKYRAIW